MEALEWLAEHQNDPEDDDDDYLDLISIEKGNNKDVAVSSSSIYTSKMS